MIVTQPFPWIHSQIQELKSTTTHSMLLLCIGRSLSRWWEALHVLHYYTHLHIGKLEMEYFTSIYSFSAVVYIYFTCEVAFK